LAGAKEKVVFAIMVMVLVWRLVQILVPGLGSNEVDIDKLIEDKPPFKPPAEEPQKFAALPNQHISAYADISVSKWNLPGQGAAPTTREDDADLPDIKLEEIKERGGIIFAKISVSGRTETIREGQSFAGRQAVLDEISKEDNRIVFTWLPNKKQYERVVTG